MQTPVQISHPTNRPNYTEVTVGGVELFFSYTTVIAYRTPDEGLVISDNVWSKTTGKHLNYINENKQRRISNDEFDRRLGAMVRRLGVTYTPAEVSA